MAVITVLQHSDIGPGRLGATLRDHGFTLDIRRVDLGPEAGGDDVPRSLENVHAVLSLGGPMDPTEDLAWMHDELDLIRAAHEAQLPVIGICLGHQLIARALGGEVEKLDTPEWGFTKVSLPVPGQTEAMIAGMPWDHHQFQSHSFHVAKAPPAAKVLAASDACPVQAMKLGLRTYGFQFHFEYDKPLIESLPTREADLMMAAGKSPEALGTELQDHYGSFVRVSERLCVNLATLAFPARDLLSA